MVYDMVAYVRTTQYEININADKRIKTDKMVNGKFILAVEFFYFINVEEICRSYNHRGDKYLMSKLRENVNRVVLVLVWFWF